MKQVIIWLIRAGLFGVFFLLTFYLFDWDFVRRQGERLLCHPGWLVWMALAYLLAFGLRALAWRTYLRGHVSFSACLHGIFYSLFINHVLPVKAGDIIRIGYIVKREAISWSEAVHSVVVLRLLDMLVLGGMAAAGILALGLSLPTVVFWFALAGSIAVVGVVYTWLKKSERGFLRKHVHMLRDGLAGQRGFLIVVATIFSWVLEAWVIYGVVRALALDISFLEGVWANSMTIAGQTFHFTPGGVGTYESVMSFSLAALGTEWQDAYLATLLSHAFKFVFSYVAGLYVLFCAPLSVGEMREWIKGRMQPNNEK
ncbi:lysylphosphatidylglycerol synthase transmembrane domain-containing protein [Aneurinibacillus thermoaerophilus]|uniref:Phosphatidylglycerol lysyltransferase n=1 Tax=Aneurinibacillus thermoaerophilus TaxID=143495 RepID=A0ABX8YEU5_ANETH|nr:lysylphosphatidylglycerol synthase transmembrane domain-containing protein [Aneurinibacillus thermoaerophilus]QYY43483.1 flippase-like domain-containing protein [Aneurinibacillus thermoaerophilus]